MGRDVHKNYTTIAMTTMTRIGSSNRWFVLFLYFGSC